MVRDGLAKLAAAAGGRGSTPLDDLPVTRPAWLEPYGGDREWRQLTWDAVVDLHERYPGELRALRVGWWNDEAKVETLCAFVHWRQRLDDAGRDPREELEFHFSLIEFGRRLKQEGGGLSTEWKPGEVPAEWV